MKKNHLIRRILMTFSILGAGNLLCADAPLFINYQGKITTPEGNPIETTVQIGFNFYNGSGIRLNSTDISLPVTPIKGVFSVFVPVQTHWFSNEEVLVGITVDDGEELSPRQRLVSAPYALAVADGTIKTNKIVNDAVTDEKIAGMAAAKLTGPLPAISGAALTGVVATDIADGAITTTKIANDAVTDEKIAGMAAAKLTGALPAISGAALTDVVATIFAEGAITTTKIADDAVITTKITNLAVTNAKIADGAITKDKINPTHIQPVYITNDNRLVLGGSDQYDTSVCGVDFTNTKVLFFDCNGLCDQDAAKTCTASQVGYLFRP